MFTRALFYTLILVSYFLMIMPSVMANPPKESVRKVRTILITGFYDWRDLGSPPDPTRCRDNPSCRILASEGTGTRGFSGPLSTTLKQWSKSQPNLTIEFALLPVTWSGLGQIHRKNYQLIIHLGLGVYDSFHRLLIEDGAYNWRKGKDAIGVSYEEKIQPDQPDILTVPPQVSLGIKRALSAHLPSPFTLVKASARQDNTYLCNATYYEALLHIKTASQENREAYFIHLPHREGDDDHALTEAVLEVIKTIIIDTP
jgi:pyrrolidone-carboxylate peptidase